MTEKQTVHSIKQPKFLILGASGRLGRLILPFWPRENTIFHSRTAQIGFRSFELLENPQGLAKIMDGIHTVICLAGITPKKPNGDMCQNIRLAKACLDAAKQANVDRVFLTSTAAVYGRLTGTLIETGPVEPVSDYGKSKVKLEEMADLHPQTSTVLRIGNVAGADAILGNWNSKMKLEELPDGTSPKRSYIGPATLARVLKELSDIEHLPKILNVAAPKSIHMNALLEAAGLAYGRTDATEKTIAEVTLDTTRLQSLVNFTAKDSKAATMVDEWKQAVAVK